MNSSAAGHDDSCPCEYTENLEILRQTDFFSGFPIEKLKVMAYLCAREDYKAGDRLFSQDDDDGKAFLVLSGTLTLTREDKENSQTIRHFDPGELIGGLALLGPMQRLFSLDASSDATCLVLSREKFAKALEQFPDLLPRLHKAVVDRIRTWEKRHLFDMIENAEGLSGRAGISVL
jgi:CRP-like cAMP-binding protein